MQTMKLILKYSPCLFEKLPSRSCKDCALSYISYESVSSLRNVTTN